MSRPTVPPDFATDTDYPAGSDDWSGQPNKVDPGGLVATGFIPDTDLATEHVNFMLGNHADWINYLDSLNRDRFVLFDEFVKPFTAASSSGDPIGDHFHLLSPTHMRVEDNAAINLLGVATWLGVISVIQNGSGTSIATVGTVNLHFAPTDIDWLCRARVTTRANLNTFADFRMGGDDGGRIGFQANTTHANWQYIDNTDTPQDTGVAVVDGDFVEFRATCISGTVTYYINGSQVGTRTTTITVGGGISGPDVLVTGKNIGDGTVFADVDCIRLTAAR